MSTPTDPVDLAQEVSPLLQALMGKWSEEAGVRALLIKGEIANLLGLRPVRGSIDADLWVSPEDFEAFGEILRERGWESPAVVESKLDLGAGLIKQHSVTHRHPAWPAEVDVHRLFPGFTLEPQEVFDLYWERRQRHVIAHQEVWGPDPAGAALIQALHHLRAPDHAGHNYEFAALTAEVSGWDAAALVSLGSLAGAAGASRSAESFLTEVGAVGELDQTDETELEKWRVATSGRGLTGLSAAHSIRSAPWRERSGLAWRHFWFTPELLRARDPAVFESGARFPVMRARVRRWRSAARDLPRVLRVSRRRP